RSRFPAHEPHRRPDRCASRRALAAHPGGAARGDGDRAHRATRRTGRRAAGRRRPPCARCRHAAAARHARPPRTGAGLRPDGTDHRPLTRGRVRRARTAGTATRRPSLAGRLTGWSTDGGVAVNVVLGLDNVMLRLERGILSLATLDLEAVGTWRFVPPAAGELRYALRVTDLAPFAPSLPLATDSIAAGEVSSEGALSGPAGRVRLAGTAAGSDLRLNGWRAASARAAYAVTLGVVPAPFTVNGALSGIEVPGLGVYDT